MNTTATRGRCDQGADLRPAQPAQVISWWRARGYNVVMPTGAMSATVIEGAPAVIAELDALLVKRGCPPPLLALPTGEHQLFSAPIPIDDDLWLATAVSGVTLLGGGAWVTLPPSVVSAGRVMWVRPPETTAWQLPPAADVRAALQGALGLDQAAA